MGVFMWTSTCRRKLLCYSMSKCVMPPYDALDYTPPTVLQRRHPSCLFKRRTFIRTWLLKPVEYTVHNVRYPPIHDYSTFRVLQSSSRGITHVVPRSVHDALQPFILVLRTKYSFCAVLCKHGGLGAMEYHGSPVIYIPWSFRCH